MKALIVGAGAVGQVYARHLELAGAEASFFVKPKYAEEAKRGYKLYPLNAKDPRKSPVELKVKGVLTTVAEVRAEAWDQVYLCVSSTALRSGWFEEFAAAIPGATLVALQPGVEDREYILKSVAEDRVVFGMISLISYPAPLPGERVPEPGVAYWFPPLSPSPFSGPDSKAKEVVDWLNRGKHPAKVAADVPKAAAFPSAVLMTLITALELSDWSFDKLIHNRDRLKLACTATREAAEILSKKLASKPPFALKLVRPSLVSTLLRISPKFVPLDLETYLRVHFTKVEDQTRFFMKTYVDLGRRQKLPTHSIEALERRARTHLNI